MLIEVKDSVQLHQTLLDYLERHDIPIGQIARDVTALRGEEPAKNRNYSTIHKAISEPLSCTMVTLTDIVSVLGGHVYITLPD